MLELAHRVAGDIKNCLFQHEHASFAVPGGTTPGPIFDALCAADLEWDRVHVMLTDERWVPESSERSNTALVRKRLLTERAAAAPFVAFYDGSDEPEDAIDDLAKKLAPEVPISVLLLGMGADMHTASIFPGAIGLEAALSDSAGPISVVRGGNAPEPRVTLTAPILKGAMTTHVVITGAEKREALERAAGRSAAEAPINLVLPTATVHWAES